VPLLGIELPLLLQTPQQGLPMLFNVPDNPKIISSRAGSPPYLIYCSLGQHESSPNGISISVQQFLQRSRT